MDYEIMNNTSKIKNNTTNIKLLSILLFGGVGVFGTERQPSDTFGADLGSPTLTRSDRLQRGENGKLNGAQLKAQRKQKEQQNLDPTSAKPKSRVRDYGSPSTPQIIDIEDPNNLLKQPITQNTLDPEKPNKEFCKKPSVGTWLGSHHYLPSCNRLSPPCNTKGKPSEELDTSVDQESDGSTAAPSSRGSTPLPTPPPSPEAPSVGRTGMTSEEETKDEEDNQQKQIVPYRSIKEILFPQGPQDVQKQDQQKATIEQITKIISEYSEGYQREALIRAQNNIHKNNFTRATKEEVGSAQPNEKPQEALLHQADELRRDAAEEEERRTPQALATAAFTPPVAEPETQVAPSTGVTQPTGSVTPLVSQAAEEKAKAAKARRDNNLKKFDEWCNQEKQLAKQKREGKEQDKLSQQEEERNKKHIEILEEAKRAAEERRRSKPIIGTPRTTPPGTPRPGTPVSTPPGTPVSTPPVNTKTIDGSNVIKRKNISSDSDLDIPVSKTNKNMLSNEERSAIHFFDSVKQFIKALLSV